MAFTPLKYYLSAVKFVDRYLWNEKVVTSRSILLRYGFTIFVIAVTTAIKILFFNLIGINTPFLLYFAVIIFVTGFGGIGPGLFATFLSAFVSTFFFISPVKELSIYKLSSISLLVFVMECIFLIALSGAVTRASRKVKKSAARFRALIENSTDAIAVFDTNGKVLYASPTTEAVIGYPAREFKSFDLSSKIHPDELSVLQAQLSTVLAKQGETQTILHRFLHKNGQWVWIESTLTNLINDHEIHGIVSNFRNVSDKLMLEKQKDDFLGIATHELKTPVTSIKAYVQILKNRFLKDGNLISANMVEKMDGQLNKLIGLIGDLLDVTKIEGGRLQLHEDWYDFNFIVSEVVEELQRTTEKHTIEIKLQVLDKIFGDRERIGQVITNLVSNAIKYSPKSGNIQVYSSINDSEVTLCVKDYGLGISIDQQPRLFERFFRVSSDLSKTYPGLGLGLFICHEIIKRQGGKIWVESDPGKGSSFYFSLPFDHRLLPRL